ncbi:hypothetical protein CEXT_555361 [Caerostris extrusa]|uniref:Uncharacterized protein n=1 Tax=Caerostris extrusa TaxID=172846 RepID=A0AAV4Q6H3_CAEEX|nr:hypothetical protein CEXT_555361 [Caerostris extrusa]
MSKEEIAQCFSPPIAKYVAILPGVKAIIQSAMTETNTDHLNRIENNDEHLENSKKNAKISPSKLNIITKKNWILSELEFQPRMD